MKKQKQRIKALGFAALLVILAFLAVSCRNEPDGPTDTDGTSATEMQESVGGESTTTPSDAETRPPLVEQDNPYEWIAENDRFADAGYSIDQMVSVDEFGRVSLTAGGEKDDRTVSMFMAVDFGYSALSNLHKGIYDVEKIIAQHGMDAVFKQDSDISPNNTAHYWGEPLYGYYRSEDIYIMRKQVELLTNLGVDVLVLDVTNAWWFEENVEKLASIIADLRRQGWDAPQLVFYCHSRSNATVRQIYERFYNDPKVEANSEAWYTYDGKPVIIAYTEREKDLAEAVERGETNAANDSAYNSLGKSILNYFWFVEPRWPNDARKDPSSPLYDKKNEDGRLFGWEWIDWNTRLTMRDTSIGTYMNVAVASHPSIPFSFSLTRNWPNYGRGYNIATGTSDPEGLYTGTYYQGCWNQVIRREPENVMITAWNLWQAQKQPWDGEYMMADACNFEYSLSIEPSNGYYKDAYVLQTIQNVRQYKYTEGRETHVANTVDIHGGVNQWYNVGAVYRQMFTKAYGRVGRSADVRKTISYRVEKPQNHVVETRVAHDSEAIYLLLRCEKTITAQNGTNWMNLFIGTGDPSLKGWNGYEYVLNRQALKDGRTTVEALNEDFTGRAVGEAEVVIRDNMMTVKIPRSVIGMADVNTFYFKVADSVADPADIMSYYTTGSVLPVGRFSYSYTAE